MEVSNSDLAVSLGQAHTKLDQLIEQRQDHEARLRTLERALWIGHGVWLVLAGVIAWLSKKF